MSRPPWLRAVLAAGLLLAACGPSTQQTPASHSTPSGENRASPQPGAPPSPGAISGVVVDPKGMPLTGATVRLQASPSQTTTDGEGVFTLSAPIAASSVTVSAWKAAYYCGNITGVIPPAEGLKIVLRPLQTNDNPAYTWVPPVGENSCYSCKPGVTQVWLDNDAHGKSAGNLRFLTMYNGTDVKGNPSPPTRYGYSRDYGRIPLLPDLTRPYFGPGYKLDFPDAAGNCAACHNPGAAIDAPYSTDPNTVSGVEAFGIHCDYCHKVADVTLDATTGLPFPNRPGVLSQDIRRPFPEDEERYQLFFGTFDDDNVPMEDTNLPLIKESRWCAPCHFGVFWDTVVYNSFGEWLASPYSDPSFPGARTCQECHMPSPTLLDGQPIANVAPGKGGIERDPSAIHAHTFPGASSQDLLSNAVTLTATARREGANLVVEASVINDKTGHHVPTDSPLRQMILLVQVTDDRGQQVDLTEGPRLPEWTGVGDPAQGNYAGLPGKAYAKVLQELWTQAYPSGSYWNPTRVLGDNRLAAFSSDASRFVFSATTGSSKVDVRVVFRRAYKELMDQKAWDVPDILMASKVIHVP